MSRPVFMHSTRSIAFSLKWLQRLSLNIVLSTAGGHLYAIPSCTQIVLDLNSQLSPPVRDVHKLAETLSVLFRSKHLPKGSYVTKKHAKREGWLPGESLWQHANLIGKSIGGDAFLNFEERLPKDHWLEADIDYAGHKNRGSKRLVFNRYGDVYLTVNHYETFVKVEACK